MYFLKMRSLDVLDLSLTISKKSNTYCTKPKDRLKLEDRERGIPGHYEATIFTGGWTPEELEYERARGGKWGMCDAKNSELNLLGLLVLLSSILHLELSLQY